MLSNKDVKLSDVTVTSNAPYFSNRAVSGKFQKRYTGVQYFSLKFTANYMSKDTDVVKRFVAMYQHGRRFSFPLSYLGEYNGSARGNIQSQSTVQPGGRQITLGAFSGTLEAGTLVQFQNHKKLYTVTEDVKSGGQMKIFPALRGTVQMSEQVSYSNLSGEFVLTDEKVDFNLQSIGKMQFNATEVF